MKGQTRAARDDKGSLILGHDNGLFGEQDLHLFNEGTHYRIYRKLGAHRATLDGRQVVAFGVWAPNAESVSVMGNFNGWDKTRHPLRSLGGSGIWRGFVPGLAAG